MGSNVYGNGCIVLFIWFCLDIFYVCSNYSIYVIGKILLVVCFVWLVEIV